MARRRLTDSPLSGLTAARQLTRKATVDRTGLSVSLDVAARVRAAAYWEPGETVVGITKRALLAEIERMEQERGEPYPPRPRR